VPVTLLHFGAVVLLSMAAVLIIRIVGLILVVALLTIPPSVAEKFSRPHWSMMGISRVLSALFSIAGLALAVQSKLTAAAANMAVASAVYLLSLLLPGRR